MNITTDVSSNLDQGEVYNVFNGYVIEFVSYLRRVGGLLRVLLFPQINQADRHDIAEILLKVALNTIKQTKIDHICCFHT